MLLCAGFLIRERIGRGWTFRGADSYAYMGAASELYENHRYAFRLPAWYPEQERAKPLPPGYGRLPGYSALLAAVVRPQGADYETFYAHMKPVQWLIDLGTCLLVFLIARRLAGRAAALVGLLLAVASPFLGWYANAILTENLATFLTTLTLFLWLEALHFESAPRQRTLLWALGGAAAGLATLTRIDSLVLLGTLAVPLLLLRGGRHRRGALLALGLFAAVYAPWPIRNYVRLGHPHVLGGQCDTQGREMAHTAFFAWFATWLVDSAETPGTLYCLFFPHCVSRVDTYPSRAFDGPEEREEVARIFKLRARDGLSDEVDAGFRALAKKRLFAHPLRTLLELPLRRAYALWVNRNDEPLRATRPHWPWPGLTKRLDPHLQRISGALAVLGALGLFGLVFLGGRHRRAALLLGSALALRTAALSLIGFVEARYLLELHPALLALSAVALTGAISLRCRSEPEPRSGPDLKDRRCC